MKQFDLIIFNMSNYSEWEGGVSNRNYHVLKQLQARPEINKILAIDYLPLTLKRAIRIYKEDLVLNLKSGEVIRRRPTNKLTKVSDKLYVYTDIDFLWRPALTMKRIKKIAIDLNFGDFILWSYYPFIRPYWQLLGQKLTVFDAVDNWLLHSSYQKVKAKLAKCYDIIKDEADVVFTVAKSLLNFFDDQPNVYWVPNGVDLVHYNQNFSLVNRDIADIRKPIIGYIGVIQDKLDMELVKYIAEKNQDKSIVLVGPIWAEQDEARDNLMKLPNVHFLGYKTYTEAPMYIQQFDLGIVPHKAGNFSASTNPMKIYEYLACGKPVVSTSNVGSENISDLVAIASDYAEFDKMINQALTLDKDKVKAQAQEVVKQYSWFNAVNKMLDLINNKLN
jgi:glycosyltransferase involved in cell wall biosynthesis